MKLSLTVRQIEYLDPVSTALTGICNHQKLRSGLVGRRAAQNRLGHAARHAENHAGSRYGSERHIDRLRLQILKHDTGFLDHPDQLLRGDDRIHVRYAAALEFLPCRLEFLCGTGHHRDMEHLSCGLFALILQERSQHLHRRTAG